MGGCISSPAPPGGEVSERDRALHRQAEKQLKEPKALMQIQVKVGAVLGLPASLFLSGMQSLVGGHRSLVGVLPVPTAARMAGRIRYSFVPGAPPLSCAASAAVDPRSPIVDTRPSTLCALGRICRLPRCTIRGQSSRLRRVTSVFVCAWRLARLYIGPSPAVDLPPALLRFGAGYT
ncbi:hypothetical protein B0H16DRAFT_1730851 [Mycena metata]|uniref:Uncharacterized protein n=1 Tax=Mycena metata TaxID=1033252 RepID=A0AAD7I7X3_9AGAR|nr:hypothetical protein B0H16DRAFT_1730851 [Mycena metata]